MRSLIMNAAALELCIFDDCFPTPDVVDSHFVRLEFFNVVEV